ncbi:MAG TPA: alkaline phosphatase family protein [Lacipirellulaceae bacterium]|nr:alkaline phosphatase family protein [Lacipirellulaceae bacterium]
MTRRACRALWLACMVLGVPHVVRADNRVLVIGIDGAGGRYLRDANTPNIDALIANGSVRYDFLNEGALVANPPAGYGASGANWSTILTGASAAHHGVRDNSFSGSRFNVYPHFFKYVKNHDPARYTASIVSWEPINAQILANQYANLERHFSNLPSVSLDAMVRDATIDLVSRGDPDAIFLHFDQVDAAGHGNGWGTLLYYAAIQTVDRHIGDIMAAVNARPGVAAGNEDWLVIITADHGGLETGHDASQGLINWEVPFVLSGNSAPDGVLLSQGTLRDVVPTALWHLGIDPFALNLDGTVRGLVVGPPNGIIGDLNQDGVVAGNGTGPAASDDVTAFVAGWLSQGSGSIAARYLRGDLNFDGITDIADWAILNRENPAMGAAAMAHLANVPEPTALLLFIIVLPQAMMRLR